MADLEPELSCSQRGLDPAESHVTRLTVCCTLHLCVKEGRNLVLRRSFARLRRRIATEGSAKCVRSRWLIWPLWQAYRLQRYRWRYVEARRLARIREAGLHISPTNTDTFTIGRQPT